MSLPQGDRLQSPTATLIFSAEMMPASGSPCPAKRSSMSERPAHHVRSATPAGIAFTITDLDIANAIMKVAMTTSDSALAMRTYNHAVRTLEETHELLLRATPDAEQQPRITESMALLSARLAAFRARRF